MCRCVKKRDEFWDRYGDYTQSKCWPVRLRRTTILEADSDGTRERVSTPNSESMQIRKMKDYCLNGNYIDAYSLHSLSIQQQSCRPFVTLPILEESRRSTWRGPQHPISELKCEYVFILLPCPHLHVLEMTTTSSSICRSFLEKRMMRLRETLHRVRQRIQRTPRAYVSIPLKMIEMLAKGDTLAHSRPAISTDRNVVATF